MEYDAGKTKPESNRTFLVQQVNEQSNVCDVTVKMGVWEKKFHRCVLAISPFFGHVLNDNFLEGQTGIIEIKIGTPVTLETTIMYLYGKKPKFNDENIENIIQMAEFLLIPNLKSACIAWLTTVPITRENCMKFLQLSSIFDFELQSCTTYIEEHLSELFHLPEMVNLTEGSMLLLFSDKRLSCAPMDDRLLFLFRWLDANPGFRRAYIKDLLKYIDIHSISNQCLQACLQNPDLACHIQSEHMTPAESNDHRVLIIKDVYYDYVFWCLDLERDQWFRVKSNSLKEELSNRSVEMSGTCTNTAGSIVCSIRSYKDISFVLLDLPNDACTKMNLIGSEEEGLSIEMSGNVKIDGNVCIVSVNKQIERNKNPYKKSGLSDIHHKFRHMSMMGLTSQRQSLALQMREKIRRRTFENIIISTLYIGHIGESNVVMSPLFSFKDDKILKYAISDNAIAIIFQSRQFVAMYDLIDGHLERESQWTSDSDEIAPIKDGFVIYDNKRCITLTRMKGECLFTVKEIPFGQIYVPKFEYFICSQMLFRYYTTDYRDNYIFEYTPFQTLVSQEPLVWSSLSRHTEWEPEVWKTLVWNQLPLPKEAALLSTNTIKESCFEIFLPKSMLCCHVDSPHCKTTSRKVLCKDTYDQDDYYYDDSSSDDDRNVRILNPTFFILEK